MQLLVKLEQLLLSCPFIIKYSCELNIFSEFLCTTMDITLSDTYVDIVASDECRNAVRNNGLLLQFCENQTYDLCREAVMQNPYAIQYAYPENLDRDLWRLAFSKDTSAISVIEDPSDTCIFDALSIDGLAIRYLRHFTPEHALAAVRQNGLAIQYIHEQTEDLCMEAMRQTSDAFMFIASQWQTERLCLFAVQQNSLWLANVRRPTEEMKRLAVMEDGHTLQWVRPITIEYCKLAIENTYTAFQFVPESFRSDSLLRFAVTHNVHVLQYVRKAPFWLLRYAFMRDPDSSKKYIPFDVYHHFKEECKEPLKLDQSSESSISCAISCKGLPSCEGPMSFTNLAADAFDPIESFSEDV